MRLQEVLFITSYVEDVLEVHKEKLRKEKLEEILGKEIVFIKKGKLNRINLHLWLMNQLEE